MNGLARRGALHPGGELFGETMENWVHHELRAFCDYHERDESLTYWRTAGSVEVDFVVGDMRVALEVKASARVSYRHLRGLRAMRREHPEVDHRILVSLEPKPQRTEDGINTLPAEEFTRVLWHGSLI